MPTVVLLDFQPLSEQASTVDASSPFKSRQMLLQFIIDDKKLITENIFMTRGERKTTALRLQLFPQNKNSLKN